MKAEEDFLELYTCTCMYVMSYSIFARWHHGSPCDFRTVSFARRRHSFYRLGFLVFSTFCCEQNRTMFLMYYEDENGTRVYTFNVCIIHLLRVVSLSVVLLVQIVGAL